MKSDKFAVFILTYGRAKKVITYDTLRRGGYTGPIYLICSTDDKQVPEYKEKYGEQVVVFNKNDYKGKFDIGDNFKKDNVVVFARNAAWDIAKQLGLDYFLELDDDYQIIAYKIRAEILVERRVLTLDDLFSKFVEFLKNTPVDCIALAQGGDFIGGKENAFFEHISRRRKIMNSFFLSVNRPFKFYGRINEDVNCYIANGKIGAIFLTHPSVSIVQETTQTNSGGLTEFYLNGGTYIKSFYTVIFNPSAVKVRMMGDTHKRLHHSIAWKNAVPVIIDEKFKK